MFTTTPGTNYLLQLDASNVPSSFVTQAGQGAWPYWGNPFGMTVDVDNHHVLVPALVDPGASTLVLARWDPVAQHVASTLWSGPRGVQSVQNWSNWTTNSDGNPVTIDNAGAVPRLVEYDRWRQTWRAVPLPAGTPAYAGLGGLEWDPIEGGYVHAAWGQTGSQPSALLRTAPDGSATRTLAVAATSITRYGGALLDNGDWIAPSGGAYRYHVVASGSTVYAPGPASAVTLGDATRETFAAAGRGFFATEWAPPGVVYVDARTGASVRLHAGTAATMPSSATEVVPLCSRDLATVRAGRATWAVRIQPGQGAFAGRTYHLAASLALPRAPLVLPDGRELFAGIDALFWHTVFASCPPLLTGNIGILDGQGRGEAALDLVAAGKSLNGLVVHFVALVLDPVAPSGVGWVCEPHAFAVDVAD